MARSTEEYEARLAVLSIAQQEICRALSPAQAEQLAKAPQDRAAQLPPLHDAADVAAAGAMAALET